MPAHSTKRGTDSVPRSRAATTLTRLGPSLCLLATLRGRGAVWSAILTGGSKLSRILGRNEGIAMSLEGFMNWLGVLFAVIAVIVAIVKLVPER